MSKNKKFDGFRKLKKDAIIEKKLQSLLYTYKVTPLEATKNFIIFIRRQLLKRFLAHAELFKMTLDIPGDIAEIGVFRGFGLMTWANLLETYCIGSRTKVVYGFDNWKGFNNLSFEDGKPINSSGKVPGGFSPKNYRAQLLRAIKIFDDDRFVSWKPRINLINGDIEDSVTKFLNKNPGLRFSLVHFDCDLYKPTKNALEAIWPRVTRGGLVLFDEYGIKEWPGETKAVDEFLKLHPELKIRCLSWNNTPAGFIIKN